MKCTICNKDETFFIETFEKMRKQLEKALNDNSEEKSKRILEYSKEHGFTKENHDILDKISNNITQMTINSFYENEESLIDIEPKLKILYKYIREFPIYHDRNGKILNLIEKFKLEPKEEIIQSINYLAIANEKRIQETLENLNKRTEIFNEIKFTPEVIGLSESDINNIHEFISNDIFNKILLCPFCSSIVNIASKASFDIIEAKRIIDFGDDEDECF